jgi:hypothetical protein
MAPSLMLACLVTHAEIVDAEVSSELTALVSELMHGKAVLTDQQQLALRFYANGDVSANVRDAINEGLDAIANYRTFIVQQCHRRDFGKQVYGEVTKEFTPETHLRRTVH